MKFEQTQICLIKVNSPCDWWKKKEKKKERFWLLLPHSWIVGFTRTCTYSYMHLSYVQACVYVLIALMEIPTIWLLPGKVTMWRITLYVFIRVSRESNYNVYYHNLYESKMPGTGVSTTCVRWILITTSKCHFCFLACYWDFITNFVIINKSSLSRALYNFSNSFQGFI